MNLIPVILVQIGLNIFLIILLISALKRKSLPGVCSVKI